MAPYCDLYHELFSDAVGVAKNVELSFLLRYCSFKQIAAQIEVKHYSLTHFHYSVELMIKLLIIKCYRKVSFRKLMYTLTDYDLENLLTDEQIKAGMHLPSGKTVHHFLCYRLGHDGVKYLMTEIGKEIVKHLNFLHRREDRLDIIIDSTPLEASRYSDADYNPHYKIQMSKAHIISAHGYPIYMRYSEGNEGDAPYGRMLIHDIAAMQPNAKYCFADKGYDNFEMYADVAQCLHAEPIIQIRDNAVISEDGTEKMIRNVVNKLWKRGGNSEGTIEEMMSFLYTLIPKETENPTKFKELVGKYYRNQALGNQEHILAEIGKRNLCEQRHAQYKNVVKFDIKGYRKSNRPLYTMLNFVAIQSIFLAKLQNNSQNTNLADYI